jgi:leader peptidase (prepilin peptidase)/N-methyltransferase
VTWFYYVVVAGFGLIFGSFFNVCIYRMPREESLGQRSHCTTCDSTIRWYDNIPLLSFILLRGRCRNCEERISWRYPVIELTTALLFILVYWWSRNLMPVDLGLSKGSNISPELFIGLILVSVLIISVGADIDFGIIPNMATYPGMIIMLSLVIGSALYRGHPGRIGLSIASGATGGGFLLVAGLVYGALFLRGSAAPEDLSQDQANIDMGGRDNDRKSDPPTGIGMGDVKLVAFVGLALGYFHWYLIILQLFLGFLIGAIVSIALLGFKIKSRKDRIPFAPFLSLGAVTALIWGNQLADLYLKLLR